MQEIGKPLSAAFSSRTTRILVKECTHTPVFLLALGAMLISPAAYARQAHAPQRTHVKSKLIEAHARAEKAQHPSKPEIPSQVAEAQPAPQKPNWPVNNPPRPPTVVLNSGVLRIDAMNSSLQQILKQVCSETGASVEGLNADQRVFGVYGPGRPRDVISQLLEGTGYNVVMVGSHGTGEPLQIVLSERPKGGTQPNAPVSPSEIAPPPYRAPVPVIRPPQHPEAAQPPRTPQQIMQEMQQREQQLRQEQMRLQQMRQQNNQPH